MQHNVLNSVQYNVEFIIRYSLQKAERGTVLRDHVNLVSHFEVLLHFIVPYSVQYSVQHSAQYSVQHSDEYMIGMWGVQAHIGL